MCMVIVIIQLDTLLGWNKRTLTVYVNHSDMSFCKLIPCYEGPNSNHGDMSFCRLIPCYMRTKLSIDNLPYNHSDMSLYRMISYYERPN